MSPGINQVLLVLGVLWSTSEAGEAGGGLWVRSGVRELNQTRESRGLLDTLQGVAQAVQSVNKLFGNGGSSLPNKEINYNNPQQFQQHGQFPPNGFHQGSGGPVPSENYGGTHNNNYFVQHQQYPQQEHQLTAGQLPGGGSSGGTLYQNYGGGVQATYPGVIGNYAGYPAGGNVGNYAGGGVGSGGGVNQNSYYPAVHHPGSSSGSPLSNGGIPSGGISKQGVLPPNSIHGGSYLNPGGFPANFDTGFSSIPNNHNGGSFGSYPVGANYNGGSLASLLGGGAANGIGSLAPGFGNGGSSNGIGSLASLLGNGGSSNGLGSLASILGNGGSSSGIASLLSGNSGGGGGGSGLGALASLFGGSSLLGGAGALLGAASSNSGGLGGGGGAGGASSGLNELGILDDLSGLLNFRNVEKLLGNVNKFDSLKCIPRMVCQTIAKRQQEAEEKEKRDSTSTTTTTTTTRRPKRKGERSGRFIPGLKIQGVDTALEQFVKFLELTQLKDWSLYPYLQGAYYGHQVRKSEECAERFTTCPFSDDQLLYYFNNYKGGLFQHFRSDGRGGGDWTFGSGGSSSTGSDSTTSIKRD